MGNNGNEATVADRVKLNELRDRAAKQIMDERASRFRAVLESSFQPQQLADVITFFLGGEKCALETRYVRAILPFMNFTVVPGTPDFVVGLINLHGQVTALMDLRRVMGASSQASSSGRHILVLGVERGEFAILVDSVDNATQIDINDLKEPQDFLPLGTKAFVRGVTEDAMCVFDGAGLLNAPGLFVNQTD